MVGNAGVGPGWWLGGLCRRLIVFPASDLRVLDRVGSGRSGMGVPSGSKVGGVQSVLHIYTRARFAIRYRRAVPGAPTVPEKPACRVSLFTREKSFKTGSHAYKKGTMELIHTNSRH